MGVFLNAADEFPTEPTPCTETADRGSSSDTPEDVSVTLDVQKSTGTIGEADSRAGGPTGRA